MMLRSGKPKNITVNCQSKKSRNVEVIPNNVLAESKKEDTVSQKECIETYEILNQHIDEMSEHQLDLTIANRDEIFDYIIDEDRSVSHVFGNVEFESTKNDDNEEDEWDEDEDGDYQDGQDDGKRYKYYDEANLEDMLSHLEIDDGVEKGAKLEFTLTKRGGRKF